MAKKMLATLLAAVMALSAAAVFPASAAARLGDVDNDGEITSGDARLALRASVKLEEITPELIARADVDNDGEVEAEDARMILRAAVKLEDLSQYEHTHQVENWTPVKDNAEYHSGICTVCGQTVTEKHDITLHIVKENTCTEAGEAEEKCSVCGYVADTVVVPADHKWETVKGTEKAATCTENGSRELLCTVCGAKETEILPAGHHPGPDATCTVPQTCTVCGEVLAPMLGHVYVKNAAVTVTKGVRCERCGETGLPGFNDLVNTLKDGTHSFTGFKITESSASEPKVTGFMKTLINMMTSMGQIKKEDVTALLSTKLGDETTYSELIKNRKITEYSYNLVGEDVVSALRENDPQSIKTEFVKGIDFLSSLPDTYVSEMNREVDLTNIKNTPIGDVIKITLTFLPEVYADVAANGGDSPICRIDSEIPKTVASFMEGAGSADLGGLASETGDGDDLGSILARSMSFDFDSTYGMTVTYYFDAVTNAPIAAVYNGSMQIDFAMNIYIDDPELNPDKESGSISVDSTSDLLSYYFFDDYFSY